MTVGVVSLTVQALLFHLGSYGVTAFIAFLYLPFLVLPGRWMHHGTRLWVRITFWLLRVTAGLDWQVRGRDHLPAGPAIFASKHQSAWETLVFYLLFDDPAYVLKRELFWIPFYGWYAKKARSVAVDRGGGARAMRSMIQGAEAAIADGRNIIIFPEGTRAAPGSGRPFHPGAAALYARLGVPLVPVALNSGLFWPRRRFLKRPGRITLEFLPAIEPGLDRKELRARLEGVIQDATRRLEGEAQSAPEPRRDGRASGEA